MTDEEVLSGFIQAYHKKAFPEPNSGCMIWMGAISAQGYGVHLIKMRAHRLSYMAFKGEIPEGMVLDHKCRVRCCVNPEHLEAVTPRENVARGIGPTALNSKKTHCPYGHELVGTNVKPRIQEDGTIWRTCRTCNRKQQMETYFRRQARKANAQHQISRT